MGIRLFGLTTGEQTRPITALLPDNQLFLVTHHFFHPGAFLRLEYHKVNPRRCVFGVPKLQ